MEKFPLLAQLVEYQTVNPKVPSSNPSESTSGKW